MTPHPCRPFGRPAFLLPVNPPHFQGGWCCLLQSARGGLGISRGHHGALGKAPMKHAALQPHSLACDTHGRYMGTGPGASRVLQERSGLPCSSAGRVNGGTWTRRRYTGRQAWPCCWPAPNPTLRNGRVCRVGWVYTSPCNPAVSLCSARAQARLSLGYHLPRAAAAEQSPHTAQRPLPHHQPAALRARHVSSQPAASPAASTHHAVCACCCSLRPPSCLALFHQVAACKFTAPRFGPSQPATPFCLPQNGHAACPAAGIHACSGAHAPPPRLPRPLPMRQSAQQQLVDSAACMHSLYSGSTSPTLLDAHSGKSTHPALLLDVRSGAVAHRIHMRMQVALVM